MFVCGKIKTCSLAVDVNSVGYPLHLHEFPVINEDIYFTILLTLSVKDVVSLTQLCFKVLNC